MKCFYCSTNMDKDEYSEWFLIQEGCRGDDIVYWCAECGALCRYFDAYPPDKDNWTKPRRWEEV